MEKYEKMTVNNSGAGMDADDQSEDGQLRSPYNHSHNDEENDNDDDDDDDEDDDDHDDGAGDNDSADGADTADSLEIKPPQAGRSDHHRYKEKKIREKKHSKERRHKDKNRMRERGDRDRDRGLVSSSGGNSGNRNERRHSGSGGRRGERDRIDRERHHQQQGRPPPNSQDIRYEMHAREREYYRQMYKERSEKMRSKDQHDVKRKESPEKSEAERALEDLRTRLLSKRNKHDAEKRFEEQHESMDHRQDRGGGAYRQSHYEYKKSREESRKDHHHQKHRSRKSIIEVIDSPEPYVEMESLTKQHKELKNKIIEDPELIARRAKLLEAEREMAKRKELARDELEARREMRRERTDQPLSPPTPGKKRRLASSDDETVNVKHRKKPKEDSIVQVSDNSVDDTATDTDTNSNTDSDADDSECEEEVPVSPLSVGELSKSERHNRTQSRSRSRSKIRSLSKSRSRSPYRSRSNSRSRSKSHSRSRTPSRSPQLRNRSRPVTPDSDFEKDKNPDRPMDIDEESTNKEAELKAVAGAGVAGAEQLLPNYYPGIQGCRSVEEFQCLNRIEEGTYGVVYRARDKRTDEIVALKRLKMEKEKEGFPITSLREINTLLKGQHSNIVTVREIVVGSNMDKIFIVMEYVEHDMKSLMETMKHRKQGFLPAEVKCLLQQLLRAVGHLHDNWILHRDLKTSNLLLSHKGILKVGDFGLAREYGSPLKAYTSIVVTLWYRAPELLLCCKEYSTAIDMWSVGCIFAELLSMQALFPGKSQIDQLNRIFKDLGTPNEKIWPGYNELPAVQKMTFTEYPVSNLRKKFSHLTSELGLSLLQGLLTYDPKQRFTAELGLASSYFKELPLPIDPAMFPTWPAKSELGARKALASSPKPPSGGGQFKQLGENDDNHGFMINSMESRQLAMGPGFSLKF